MSILNIECGLAEAIDNVHGCFPDVSGNCVSGLGIDTPCRILAGLLSASTIYNATLYIFKESRVRSGYLIIC